MNHLQLAKWKQKKLLSVSEFWDDSLSSTKVVAAFEAKYKVPMRADMVNAERRKKDIKWVKGKEREIEEALSEWKMRRPPFTKLQRKIMQTMNSWGRPSGMQEYLDAMADN